MGLLKPFKVYISFRLSIVSLVHLCCLSLEWNTLRLCYQVLLLDEITVDLDVLARADLLRFLKKECEERGVTIIYATHIFDGLEDWPSHIVSLILSTVHNLNCHSPSISRPN